MADYIKTAVNDRAVDIKNRTINICSTSHAFDRAPMGTESAWTEKYQGYHSVRAKATLERLMVKFEAAQTWRATQSIGGTLAETHLLWHHLASDVPRSIRFGQAPTGMDAIGVTIPRGPAMVCPAHNAYGRVVSAHYTRLDEHGRKIHVGYENAHWRLRGLSLHLGQADDTIMLVGAVEEALALKLMFPGMTIWSAFDDFNLSHTRFPHIVRNVIVCGGGSFASRAAVASACLVFRTRGLKVTEFTPGRGYASFTEEWVMMQA